MHWHCANRRRARSARTAVRTVCVGGGAGNRTRVHCLILQGFSSVLEAAARLHWCCRRRCSRAQGRLAPHPSGANERPQARRTPREIRAPDPQDRRAAKAVGATRTWVSTLCSERHGATWRRRVDGADGETALRGTITRLTTLAVDASRRDRARTRAGNVRAAFAPTACTRTRASEGVDSHAPRRPIGCRREAGPRAREGPAEVREAEGPPPRDRAASSRGVRPQAHATAVARGRAARAHQSRASGSSD